MTKLTPVEQWLLDLERERVSRWIKPTAAPEPQVIEKPCTKAHEDKRARAERDRIFYDAGRFAAGDRDQEAIKANERLRRSRKEGKK